MCQRHRINRNDILEIKWCHAEIGKLVGYGCVCAYMCMYVCSNGGMY